MKLKYFAWVREQIGAAEEEIEVPAGVATVGELIAWLKSRGPEFEAAFAKAEVIRAAIDQTHAKHTAPIAGAREIAFFPPVTGG
ncbi:MAG: molybdopterin converting factor subunit 1 [Rhizobiales bacterium]|nr:molybdopterin converting factor subunit 1 [Hyphomicrobiales bacterium]